MALFDVRELVKMAIKDEETGIAFYKALAATTRQPNVEAQMITIANEEEIHARRFQKILGLLGGYKPMEEYSGQYEDYLIALLETRAFPDPVKAAERAKAAHSDLEAVDIAIRLEKDTLIFLAQVKELVPPGQNHVVKEVIREEEAHLTQLARLRETLK